MNFIYNFKKVIKKYNMINNYDKIIVGVSGGADSICLLYTLHLIRKEYDIEIVAAHLNHNLRLESKKDQEFVEEFCNNLHIPLYVKTSSIREISSNQKISEELAGRQERYNYFFHLKKKLSASKIALAHNKNDQAETMIMRFFRGTGIDGLKGIPPVRKDGIIRPLIETDRQDIEQFCTNNNLLYVTDKTNLETKYLRNKIRLNILPLIQKEINSNVINNLYYMSEMFCEDYEYIHKKVNKKLTEIVHKKDNKVYVNIELLFRNHISIIKRLIRKAYEEQKGHNKDLEYKHVDLILNLLKSKKSGLEINLPGNIVCVKEYNNLVIKNKESNMHHKGSYELVINGVTQLRDYNLILESVILEDLNLIEENDESIILDYDNIKDKVVIRSRKNGDKILPRGMNGSKKAKDLFIDKKIPRSKRDNIPLLTIGDEVIWIIGLRKSRKYIINNNTKKMLYIKARWDNNA